MISCSSRGLGWDANRPHRLAVGAIRYDWGMNDQPKIDAADIINRLSAELSAMTTRAVLAESRVAELEREQAKDGAES
nr:MAG TPA: hypothetical protein [Caudoviricetes sp.]